MMTIPGYALTAPLCEGGDLVVHRANRMRDGLPVLLKVPSAPGPTPLILSRLAREYELARNLDPNRIVRPIALERHAGTAALVLAHGPDRSLASILGSAMEIQAFLQIAIGITDALAELHRQELIHKDIKPDHVMLFATGARR
jgi:serine/threonine protein kinase